MARTFERYLLSKWGYQKSQGYQLADVSGFIAELERSDSANAEKLPVSEAPAVGWVVAVPVERPLASRYLVRALPPELGRVVAVPVIRPEASQVTDCTVPPALIWRSMVWTIRPEASRTTSRQVWAVD